VSIEKVVELNEYRSDTDFKILSIAFKINCARTHKNLEKIKKYISILNAEFTSEAFFEDYIRLEPNDEIFVHIKTTDTFRALQALIRLIRYLKETKELSDAHK